MENNVIIEYTDDLVDSLNFNELKDFLYVYNKYIIHFYEEHDNGSIPVDMIEFYNNDYFIIKEGE